MSTTLGVGDVKTVAKVVNAGKLAVAKDYAPDEALGPRVVVPVFLGLYHTQARHRRRWILRHIVRRTAAFLNLNGPGLLSRFKSL